ncbi:unnamed protein product [Withania somnifera]
MGDFNTEKSNKVNYESETQELPECVIGKEGLRKKILRKGNSWKTPSPGDEILVHYRLKLQDGEFLDSTHGRGKPFTFKLGQGEVIKGWDEGIATMKKSEIAIFTIPPNLAYGEIGSPPLIPPNSTLIFEIELVSWNSIRDISGDGGILKKIIKEGEGWATPRELDEVLVKYVASSAEGKILSKSDDGVEFSLLEGYLYPPMKKSVKTMRKGEIAELTVKPAYYFGNSSFDGDGIGILQSHSHLIIHLELISWKSVVDKMEFVFERKGSDEEPFEYVCLEGRRSNSDNRLGLVLYEIKLVDFNKEKPFWKMDTERKLKHVKKLRMKEMYYSKMGSFNVPQASKFIQFDHSFNNDEKCRANTLRLSCYLSSLFIRRAQAYLRINELEKAEIDIKKALQVDPNNGDVKVMYKELKIKQKHYIQHEVEIFSTMISRLT